MGNTDQEEADRAAAREFGRWLFAQECRFIAGAATIETLPGSDIPEVAFAGRSNVGKSSLINALTGRRTLARISQTPGRTRQINIFSLGDRLMLADLPGYGYARASKSLIQGWTLLADLYLRGRPRLRRVCLLVDARRGPKDTDRALMERLDKAAVVYQIVLTKTDKLTEAELTDQTASLAAAIAKRPAAHPAIAVSSAQTGRGIAELRAELATLAATMGSGRAAPSAVSSPRKMV